MIIVPTAPELTDKTDTVEVRKSLLDLCGKINKQQEDFERLAKSASARFGSELNYTEFQSDGFLQSQGKAKQYKDLILPVSNLRPGATAPAFAVFVGGIYAFRFNAGTGDMLYGSFEIQHDYDEGSDLYVHVHWSPTTTNTGNIVWGFEYTSANALATFPAPTTALGTPTAAPGVVDRHTLQNIAIIPGNGIKIGNVIVFRIFRQAGGTDTFTGNAFLHSIGVHYAADTLGSRQITAKL